MQFGSWMRYGVLALATLGLAGSLEAGDGCRRGGGGRHWKQAYKRGYGRGPVEFYGPRGYGYYRQPRPVVVYGPPPVYYAPPPPVYYEPPPVYYAPPPRVGISVVIGR